MDNTKECPFCGEEILDVAKKCKHCGEWLEKTAIQDLAKSETVNARLENLYKLARRARENGDSEQAYKKYEEILSEDPDNWEPAFFVAYYSAVNALKNDSPGDSVRVNGDRVSLGGNYRSGLRPAINSLGENCLHNVFDLIEKIQDYDEQKAAAETVDGYIQSFAEFLHSVVLSEARRMEGQICDYDGRIEGGFRQVNKMYKQSRETAKAYDDKISFMTTQVSVRRALIEEIIAKRRFAEFWAANQPLKAELESEKQSLNEQVIQLNKDIEAVPGYKEMVDSQKQLDEEKNNAQSLIIKPKTGWLIFGIIAGIIGAFFTFGISLVLSIICGVIRYNKMKPYKAQQADVESVFKQKTQSLNEKYSRVISDVEAIKKNIASCESRIGEIDTELTKPR